ncbi:MAG TPA: hypothetical protein VJZ72_12205 [Candidatus Limnocylindrales bacterium]|nr:hypothetical protein [Candidatus Limnocylindrales bacterium]
MIARDIAATADGFVAVGMAFNTGGCGVGLPCTAAVFTSPDGRTWQREQIELPVEALPAPYEGMVAPDGFSDAVVVGGRIIATADEVEPDGLAQQDVPGLGGLWWSTDGTLWNPLLGVPADLSPAYWQPIAAGPDGAVIVPAGGGDIRSRFLVSPPG